MRVFGAVANLVLAAACLLAPLGAARDAAAESPPSTDTLGQARAHFKKGVALYGKKKYRDAIDELLAADALAPSPAFAFNVALAFEDMGDVASALRWYREYVRRAPAADDRREIDAKVKRLEERLRDNGKQQLTVFSTPPGATLALDGRPVGVTPFTGELAPGKHVAVVSLRDHDDLEQELELPADHAIDVQLTLKRAAPVVAPPVSASPVPVAPPPASAPLASAPEPAVSSAPLLPPPSSEASVRPGTWISLGLGTALLGGAVLFEALRSSSARQAGDAPTQVEAATQLGTMESRRTTARVLASVSAIAFATGGVLLALDLTRVPASPQLGLACLPGQCGVSLTGVIQ